jgi:hypothetical protein
LRSMDPGGIAILTSDRDLWVSSRFGQRANHGSLQRIS